MFYFKNTITAASLKLASQLIEIFITNMAKLTLMYFSVFEY